MLNRAALILRYKQPFVDWINAVDAGPTAHVFTLSDINQEERTVYLVEAGDQDELAKWLGHHHREVFETELWGWYTDPKVWPPDRSLKVFQEWCSFELNTVVLDFGDSVLEDDDLEE